jgi:hypothetical protein
MNMRLVPIAAGLAPVIAIHLCYLVAIHHSGLPACNPYVEGCVSISATGRYEPASYLFKAVMLPNAVLLSVYWLLNVAWLRAFDDAMGNSAKRYGLLGVFGIAGALFLILYVTFLGSTVPFYEFRRRFGIYLYFLLSVLAQLMLASRTVHLAKQYGNRSLRRGAVARLALSVLPCVLGILNLTLKLLLDDSDRAENIIEWSFALTMQCFIVLSWFCWRISGLRAAFSVTRPPRDHDNPVDSGRKSS